MDKNKHLVVSSILFTIVLFIWPVFMALFMPQGDIEEQFRWILENLAVSKLQFFFAFLISPALIYLMYVQLEFYPTDRKFGRQLGFSFLTAYLVLNSIAYASQMIVLPGMLKSGSYEQAQIWYMGSKTSVIYFFNQMGYCFWAIGTIILFANLIKESGMIRYLSIIYTISAILSVVAFAGLIVESKILNSMTIVSGMALIPVGILSVIWGRKNMNS